jgi:hypothetical protein
MFSGHEQENYLPVINPPFALELSASDRRRSKLPTAKKQLT